MFEYLQGRIALRKPTYAVIDVGGVGYRVDIPLSTYEKLPDSGNVKVFTYLKVAEDQHRLFGFATERERDIFLRLVDGVSGLGPAKAVAILSNIAPNALHKAIEEGDVATLKRVKGIGDKLAQRLIVELKGKLPDELTAGKDPDSASLEKDAAQALIALGYDRTEAEQAVRRARKNLGAGVKVEELIKRSLANV